MSALEDGWLSRWGRRFAAVIGWILISIGLLVITAWVLTALSDESARNVTGLAFAAGVPMGLGLWLVRLVRRMRPVPDASALSTASTSDAETAGAQFGSWVYAIAFAAGVLVAGIGLALVVGAVIEGESALLIGTVLMAILATPLISFGTRPRRYETKQIESGLPPDLSRRQRYREVRAVRLHAARVSVVERYESRHGELIQRLQAVGHSPVVHAVWAPSTEGGGWSVILFCSQCGLKRPAVKKARRLSPNRSCTP